MTRLLILALLLPLTFASASAQFDHQHKAWSVLLKKHVVLIDGGKASQVDYSGFQQDRAQLKVYLETLSRVTRREFEGWGKPQRLAFLINAYNAATVEKILTRYPDIKSIWEFGKILGNPFKDKFIRLLDREMSLDNIEHDTIRADGAYNDPRIHFAVNCAAITCPMLREEAYVAERLDRQLEEQTVRFLSDRNRNRHNPESGALEVSKIFDSYPWYGGDFRRGWKGFTSLEQFFAKYAGLLASNPEHQQLIRSQKVEIRFLDYDWGLNDAKR
ncbi:MAG: DUF547 domain-containing protein [Betaproteobacteria bacterium]|nr:DUF547 domain-containing protein [Betaproteobacteria bacterium]MBI3937379.1 DUF547 domain-containing protein [Betaproteobacteria bacterium]